MPAQPYAPGAPPLLLTKRLSAFLHSNLSAHVHSALITTVSGKLLSYASRQPVSTLRTQCTVAASIWGIQTAAGAGRTTLARTADQDGYRRGRTSRGRNNEYDDGDDDDDDDDDDDEQDEDGKASTRKAGNNTLVGALPTSASAESVASAQVGRPRSITVQLSGAVVVIRPLKSKLLFICIGPSAAAAAESGTAAPNSELSEEHGPVADGAGSPPQVTVSAAAGSPSETTSVLSTAPSTAATATSVGSSAAASTRRHAEEMAKWLDDQLATLWVPDEGGYAR